MGINQGLGQYEQIKFVLDSDEARAAIRAPDWKTFQTILSQETLTNMQKFDDESDAGMDGFLEKEKNIGKAVCEVLEKVSDESVLKYTLQLTEDALMSNFSSRAKLLFGSSNSANIDLISGDSNASASMQYTIAPFVKLLRNNDVMVQAKALYVACLLLSVAGSDVQDSEHVKVIISYIIDAISAKNPGGNVSSSVPGIIQSLAVLLRNSATRNAFISRNGLISLFRFVESSFASLGADAQYTVILSIWTCCFDETGLAQVDQSLLPILVNVLQSDPPIRTMRVCVAALRLAVQDPERQKALCETLIEAKLPKLLEGLQKSGRIKDHELLDDIQWLRDTLSANFSVLTTFARHEQELLTKKLKWSMIHEEIFWKENALKFEQNNFSSVRLLLKILEESQDEQTKAVACSDIGYFVQYFPNGKVIVDSHGGKLQLMKLLADESPLVQKHALLACSKIMVNNWASVKAT